MKRETSMNMYPKQSGMVLLVGLVMVLLITIVGMAAIRGTGLQESMAGNMRDRNIAFQAAESALRVGEAIVAPESTLPSFSCNKGSGVCEDISDGSPEKSVIFWGSADWSAEVSVAKVVDLGMANLYASPSYLVERLSLPITSHAASEGSGIGVGSLQNVAGAVADPFRITSRGVGITPDSVVVVQSTYLRPQ